MELTLGGVFLWRGITGHYAYNASDRFASSALGWYLLVVNLCLFWGVCTSLIARRKYLTDGSYGLENDLSRVAHIWHWSLQSCAGLMVGLVILAVILTFALSIRKIWLDEKLRVEKYSSI